jgi:chromosome segregation protein
LSRANELEKLKSQEKELEQQLLATDSELREAQRAADQVQFQLDTAREQLRQAQDQVLMLQGQEKQHEILHTAITEAVESARKERNALQQRNAMDAERIAAHKAKVQVYTEMLSDIRRKITVLEGSQSETAAATASVTEAMTSCTAEEAALEAERNTALSHGANLQQLRSAMEGDKEKRLALIEATWAENDRLQTQIRELLETQQENDRQVDAMRAELQQILSARAQIEATKTRAERDSQEKNKDILTMERACAGLEQKKLAASMEEKQIIDKLWDSYGLTPGTAGEHRGQIESVTAGNRRIGELKRKIAALGTPNLGAIEEYARVNERYSYLSQQRDDVLTSKRELESIIRDITKEMTTIFVTEFQKIDHYFGQVFEEMFGGGKGQLILEDKDNPLTCGIEIRVQPPGKQVKTITLLSGGEKAFVATALYFAI